MSWKSVVCWSAVLPATARCLPHCLFNQSSTTESASGSATMSSGHSVPETGVFISQAPSIRLLGVVAMLLAQGHPMSVDALNQESSVIHVSSSTHAAHPGCDKFRHSPLRLRMHHYRQALQRQHPCGFAARGHLPFVVCAGRSRAGGLWRWPLLAAPRWQEAAHLPAHQPAL